MFAYNTLPEMLLELPSNDPQHPSLLDRVDGAWRATPLDLLRERVIRLAIALDARGLGKGEPVGLLVPPSAEWLTMDLAIQLAGGVSVPFFVDFSAEHLAYKIRDAGIRTMFVMRQDLWSRFAPLAPMVKAVITDQPLSDHSQYVPYMQLLDEGDKRLRKKRSLPRTMAGKVSPDDLATILYTSGSTGDPKGVELTQRNFMSQLAGMTEWFHFEPGEDVALSCLPLAHAFERTVLYFYLSQRIDVYFADDVHRLPSLLKDVRPTMMTTVPRMLEKIYDKMWERAHTETGWRRTMAEWVLQSAAHQEEHPSGLGRKVAEEIIGRRVKKALGGRLKVMVTGGAAMRPDLYDFYVRVGVPLYQGYGLTEASPIISTNAPGRHKIGTVGKPLPGVSVRIAPDGEIQSKGPNTMRGYHGKPTETAAMLDENGWLHTGDLGHVDSDGFLVIEARKKELFKTSTGEYVSPIAIEQALSRSPLIDMACVVAEGRKYASCLLFVNRDGLMRMKQSTGSAATLSLEDFLKSPDVENAVAELIRQVNEPLDPWARIRHHLLILDAPTIENGGLTPTMKLCRHIIERKYQAELDALYRDSQLAEVGS